MTKSRRESASRGAEKLTPGLKFRPPTPLFEARTYCGSEHHLRGFAINKRGSANDKEIDKTQRKQIYKLIDQLHDEGISASSIVIALLDCAVDLTAAYLPNEGKAYTPFVEATAHLFNHYAAVGVSDIDTPWDLYG